MSTEDVHLLLGAYVLGGLGDADRALFEAHLSGCDRCPLELAASAGIPALLRRVDRAVPDLHHVPRPGGAALVAMRRQRRRRRTAAVCIAAASVLTATTVAITVLHDDSPAADARFTASGRTSAAGDAVFEARPWGTAIQLDLSALPARGTFALEVLGRDGTVERAATWSGTSQEHIRVTAATSIPRGDITELQVVSTEFQGEPSTTVAVATPSR